MVIDKNGKLVCDLLDLSKVNCKNVKSEIKKAKKNHDNESTEFKEWLVQAEKIQSLCHHGILSNSKKLTKDVKVYVTIAAIGIAALIAYKLINYEKR